MEIKARYDYDREAWVGTYVKEDGQMVEFAIRVLFGMDELGNIYPLQDELMEQE